MSDSWFTIRWSDDGVVMLDQRILPGEEKYLVLASVLAGVHHGISNQLDPGPPSFGNACQELDPDFPSEWPEAIERLRSSELLKQYLGGDYVQTYAEAKRLERLAYMEQVPKEEFDWYL